MSEIGSAACPAFRPAHAGLYVMEAHAHSWNLAKLEVPHTELPEKGTLKLLPPLDHSLVMLPCQQKSQALKTHQTGKKLYKKQWKMIKHIFVTFLQASLPLSHESVQPCWQPFAELVKYNSQTDAAGQR